MIKTKKELKFYLQADLMMNRGAFDYTLMMRIKDYLANDFLIRYLRLLRIVDFEASQNSTICQIKKNIHKRKLKKYGMMLGYSIPVGVFGYGLVIPHHGTIVIGAGNRIGNYCVLHSSTCITTGGKKIGSAFYLSTGAKIIHDIHLGDNVSVGANSVVNKGYELSDCLIAGMPAKVIKDSTAWYIRDGEEFASRHNRCEDLYRKTFEC